MFNQRNIFVIALALCFVTGASADVAVVAKKHAVIAGHPEATRLGVHVLESGGNAVDALVTVSLSLGVVEPGNSGLGGKLALLYYDAKTHKVTAMIALEQGPTMDLPKVLELSSRDRQRGWRATGVPGLPAGLGAMHEKFGSKPWKELVEPAAHLAEKGFDVSPLCAEMMSEFPLQIDAEAARIYAPTGHTPAAGEHLANADLAKTLNTLANGGYKAFYEGEIAQQIVAAANKAGWSTTAEDFKNFKPRFLEPVQGNYRNYKVFSGPPPLTGGSTVVAALDVLDQLDLPADARPRDAKYIDRVSKVLQQVNAPINKVCADIPEAREKIDAILSPESIKTLAEKASHADPALPYSMLPTADQFAEGTLDDTDQASTTHLIIIDDAGNIVCATQSLGLHFGAAVVAPGTGILMSNAMNNFSYSDPKLVNYVATGKMPRSTIAPTIVFENDQPRLVIGAPGGQRIPTGVLQVTLDVLRFNRALNEAIDGPRFHLRRPTAKGEPQNIIDLDKGSSPSLGDELTRLGWKPVSRKGTEFYFGAVNAAIFRADGSIFGVADQRRTGDADGD